MKKKKIKPKIKMKEMMIKIRNYKKKLMILKNQKIN